MHFLDDVDVWLRLRTSGARACEVGAVQQIQILVHTRTENGDAWVGAARSRGGRDARCRPNEIEHAKAPNRNRRERFLSKSAREACSLPVNDRSRLDRNGLGDGSHF